MKLEKLTKLSDLKKKQEQTAADLDEAWTKKKDEIISKAKEKFKNFFAETKFTIQNSEERLLANYDNITISLENSKNNPEIKAGPYYLTFELTIDIDEPQETVYKIPVDQYDKKPILKKKFRVRQYCSDDIDGKIEKIEQSISEIEEMISNFKEVKLGFATIEDTTSSKNILENKKMVLDYDNFEEVLSDVFN